MACINLRTWISLSQSLSLYPRQWEHDGVRSSVNGACFLRICFRLSGRSRCKDGRVAFALWTPRIWVQVQLRAANFWRKCEYSGNVCDQQRGNVLIYCIHTLCVWAAVSVNIWWYYASGCVSAWKCLPCDHPLYAHVSLAVPWFMYKNELNKICEHFQAPIK